MDLYIGTKLIKAVPMPLGQYNNLQGWKLPEGQEPHTPGYLVEYLDGGKPNHPDFAGYISWSPKDVFERAYQPTSGMDFGMALNAIKAGKYVSRSGWNGPGQYIFGIGMPGSGDYWTYTNGKNDNCKLVPFLAIRTVQNSTVPWLASQTDMLATDWYIVD
ncbi:MAG TPA: DUF2829 domain-containing protein [Rheinheimera sp.]|uniref:DUF2829 domain-containing protein n=1 Tax=Rheinheimera sp. TaxID=1869214 RepID=UPI000EF0C029|nr:DUF2829 domain-containing protein [Rheinheimera sp.]HCU64561.1 DUF2829 domain-containing protein [Rheinheimera sp.]